MTAESARNHPIRRSRLVRLRGVLWHLTGSTVSSCMRYRVTGLAAEAAFFAILSLPPLVFGLAGSVTYIVTKIDPQVLNNLQAQVIDLSGQVLTPEAVDDIVKPTLQTVLQGPRFDVLSIGFVLALWSGSRALNVFVDTITIMYGLGGRRGIVRTRVLSFSLYVVGLIVGVVVLPLVLAGPELVRQLLPPEVDFLNSLYWPIVIVLSVAFLTTLYHVSVPVRTSWRYNIPGAVFAFAMLVIGGYILRIIVEGASTSIYGPLAAPIAMLLLLYVMSLGVLIGAALNAAFDRIWPETETAGARLEIVKRLRRKNGREPAQPVDIDDI